MEKYKSNPNFVKALEYIGSHDLASMENGTYQIDADNVYVNIVECRVPRHSESSLVLHAESRMEK